MNHNDHQLKDWVAETFNLADANAVVVSDHKALEGEPQLAATDIVVPHGKGHAHVYTIRKPVAEITREDVRLLRSANKDHKPAKKTWISKLLRFLALWLGISWLYAGSSGVCPFCGQPGCPVGAGSAGVVGAFIALVVQNWRASVRFVRARLFARKTKSN